MLLFGKGYGLSSLMNVEGVVVGKKERRFHSKEVTQISKQATKKGSRLAYGCCCFWRRGLELGRHC